MKRTKITAVLLILALMISTSGCSRFFSVRQHDDDETEEEETTEETTEETATEETEATPTPEPVSEATPTAAETSEETTEETVLADTTAEDMTELFGIYSDFLADYVVYNPNEDLRIGFGRHYDSNGGAWDLLITDADGENGHVFSYVDGEVTEMEGMSITSATYPLDVFLQIPCFFEFWSDIEYVEHPADGRYFGGIEALSLDGRSAIIYYGDPIVLTASEVAALRVGDTIDVEIYGMDRITVTNIETDSDHTYVQFDAQDLYLYQAYGENPDDYLLMSSSDNPVTVNERLAIVSVADNCVVTDTYSYLTSQQSVDEFYASHEETGIALLDSYYFYYITQLDQYQTASNGWQTAHGLLYPVTISDGQIVQMNAEWR